ncbi:MAG: chain length determinant protein tyrosine kinase EpsG [Pseudomonadota bacterium]|jgi:chain length determinant protein tyrosine kinase EpsG
MNNPAPANTAAPVPPSRDSSIGGLLLESGKITPENAERVLRMQRELGIRFGEAAQRLGLITEADIQHVLARQFDYPYLLENEGKFSHQLVAAYQPFSVQVETLRAIRSQLILRWFQTGRKSLAILSINPEDNAALFCANLAIVFSQLGEHTLLVDANLRAPRQSELFDLKAQQGLSDMLAGRAEASSAAKIDSFVDLSVLPAGTLPPNPQELLNRPAFGALNMQLENRYDVVLYDTPALSLGSESLAIAARAGGALLLARKNKTPLADLNAVTTQLTSTGVQVVGSVLVDF